MVLAQAGFRFRGRNPDLDIRLVRRKELPPGCYSLRVSTRTGIVLIESSGPEGGRCGLYAFLEAIGIRWFSPSEKPMVPRPPLTIRNMRRQGSPSFPGRGLHICGAGHFDRRVADWMSFLKMNRKLTHHREVDQVGKALEALGLRADTTAHSYSFWIPDGKYFRRHPEWFALVGGKRIPRSSGGQLCLSNLRMRDEFVRNMESYVESYPGVSVMGIPPNDGYGWCECEECMRLDTAADRQAGTVNGRVAHFVADVCGRMERKHPGVAVGHYSYSNFADFFQELGTSPANLAVSCTVFRCFKHAMNDPACPVNRPIWKRIRLMAKTIKRISIYDYYAHRWGYLPAPIWKTVAGDLAAYKSLGIEGFLTEVPSADSPSYRSLHLPLYVTGRLLYDVREDAQSILADYCARRFGPACGHMRRYFATLEEGLRKMRGCFTHRPADFEKMFTPGVRRACARLLDAALARTRPGTDSNCRVLAEKELFDRWRHISDTRPSYRYDSPITSLPLKSLALSVEPPVEHRLALTDWITLIPPAANQTYVSVYSDKKTIGLLIDCHESRLGELKLERSHGLASVSGGSDNVEIFLAANRPAKMVYHILVNAGGYHCASACEGPKWDWTWPGDYRVQTRVLRDRWRVMFTIPRHSVGTSGNVFFFTVVRNRKIDGWEITGIPHGGVYFNSARYLQAT